MDRLNEILHEVGISKVKLAKFLGVSRQMIYNYLELDSINKWPKDKKVLLLNLLGVKSSEDINKIKVTTDYIYKVDERLNTLCKEEKEEIDNIYEGVNDKHKVLLQDVIDIIKEKLNKEDGFDTISYLYHYLQSMDTARELKYILGYVSKVTGFVNHDEFVFDPEQQFIFESILFTAFQLYNGGNSSASKNKLAAAHEKFVAHIEHKKEEQMSRTMELNAVRLQALKELGYTEVTKENASEVFNKIAEIESRKIAS